MNTTVINLLCPAWGFAKCEVDWTSNGVHATPLYKVHAIRRLLRGEVAESYPSPDAVLSLNGGPEGIDKLLMEATLGKNARREPGYQEPKPPVPFGRKKKKPVSKIPDLDEGGLF